MNRAEEADGEVGHHTPVLIVGGSLVGLSTSLFLGRLGVPHTLVERHSGTSIHPRGRGNNVRTMELFRVAGVERRIEEAASVLADNHGILQTPSLVGDVGEWLFKEIDPGGGLARFSPSGWWKNRNWATTPSSEASVTAARARRWSMRRMVPGVRSRVIAHGRHVGIGQAAPDPPLRRASPGLSSSYSVPQVRRRRHARPVLSGTCGSRTPSASPRRSRH